MALEAAEVRIGITGALYSAPLGTATAPTNAASPLDEAFINHGYSSDDGVTENNSDSTSNIVAWQNATTVRSVRTETTLTFATSLLQTRGSNLELFYIGSRVEANGEEWRLDVVLPQAEPRQFVLDVIDGPNLKRIYMGNAEITERGEVPYQNGDATMFPITITCYPFRTEEMEDDDLPFLMQQFSNSAAWGLDTLSSP